MKFFLTIFLTTTFYQPLFTQSFWQRANGPEGLNIKTLNYSPQGVFYATAYYDRVFRSEDNGFTWDEIQGPNTGFQIRNLKVGYNGTLFCQGEDWNTVYRSTDLGETWSIASNPYFSGIYTEAADGGVLVASNGSIFRTYDNVVWDTLFLNPDPWNWNFQVVDLGWLPDGSLVASPDDCYHSFSGKFFLLSQDNGISWDSLPGAGPIADLVALGNGEYIFSSEYCNTAYKTSIGSSTATYIPPNVIFPEQDYFVVMPSGSIIVSNYYESRISDDGGTTWQSYNGSVYNSLSNHVLPGNLLLRGKTYAGNTMRSTNLGETWKFSGYGVSDTWVFDLTFKGTEKAFGLTSSGLWRSLDAGENWQIVPQDSSTTSTEFSVYNLAIGPNGDIYLIRPYLLQRSTNDGETFQNISPDSSLGQFVRVAVHPQTGDLYLARDSNFIRSSDQGQTWVVMNTDIRFSYRPIVFHPNGAFFGIAYSQNGAGSTLVRSDDGGITWQYVSLNPPYNLADNVLIAPDGKIVATYYATFYTSSDIGNTWTKRGIPIDANCLKLNAAGHAYIGDINDKRVFKTENNGDSWLALPPIPSTVHDGIIELAFDHEQRLWVCTDGDGHFKTVEKTVDANQPNPNNFMMEIFPNPAHVGFWINWVREADAVQTVVSLRDMHGRVVLEQPLNAAPGYVAVPALISGLYILELKEGQRRSIGKVFLK